MSELSLSSAVNALLKEQAWEVRVHVHHPELSLLLLRRADEDAQWLELRGDAVQGEQYAEALKALGLRRRRHHGGGRALGMDVGMDASATDLLSLLDRVLNYAGDGPRGLQVQVACQRDKPPENPRLLEAIRAASNSQDTDTRKRLYAALVNATLLVPQDPKHLGQPEHVQEPLKLDDSTWMAFSDWDALRMWSPHGHAFGLVHGVDFFDHVHGQGSGTVRINPEGVVGGELYPAEVAMMVEAVRGYLNAQRTRKP